MNSVHVGDVKTFPDMYPTKENALKPLEEAAEVFGAWQKWSDEVVRWGNPRSFDSTPFREKILDECADVITATCNLIAALGVEDFTPYMEACADRNRERGRM